MNNVDFLGFVGLLISLIVFGILVKKYFQNWNQIKRAYIEANMKWPLNSQEEMNKETRKNIFMGYKLIWGNMTNTARIIFLMRTQDPTIKTPLRGLRCVLITFLLFPFILAFILLVVSTFLAT